MRSAMTIKRSSVNDAEASKLQVVEEQIELEVFAGDFERNLAADEGEANSQFDEKLAKVRKQPFLQIAFLRLPR